MQQERQYPDLWPHQGISIVIEGVWQGGACVLQGNIHICVQYYHIGVSVTLVVSEPEDGVGGVGVPGACCS